jgi:hypothetical protein
MNPQIGFLLNKSLESLRNSNLESAEIYLKQAMRLQSNNPHVLRLMGVIAAQRDQYEEAISFLNESLKALPKNPLALSNLGNVYLDLKEYNNAIDAYDKSIKLESNHAEAWSNKGVALHELKRYEEALAHYDKALNLQPDYAIAWSNKGNTLSELGRFDQALEHHNKALSLRADNPKAFANKGITLHQMKRYEDAIRHYDAALNITPHDYKILLSKGFALHCLKLYTQAIEQYEAVLRLSPEFVEAWVNKAFSLHELKRYEEAVTHYDKALSLNPNDPKTWTDKASSLHELQHYEEAIAHYDKALSLNSNDPKTWTNKGATLYELMLLPEAIAHYDKALSLQSDYYLAAWNKAMPMLLQSDFENGLPLYETRWQAEKVSDIAGRRFFDQQTWSGNESLQGKTILLYGEQGLGDFIQFCRYSKVVADLGANVILEAPEALTDLLQDLDGVSQLVIRGQNLPHFDLCCPLLSLPSILKTNLSNIPAQHSYLKSHPNKVAGWNLRLGEKKKKRIGIAWSSLSGFSGDAKRSLALEQFVKALPSKKYEYICLQKEIKESDKDFLALHQDILYFGDELKDFSDTAALVDCMDLVISTCTSIPHLSAALGKETWLLLSRVPDWRWLLDREDSPWYPAMKLYRQQALGDWDSVFERVKIDLGRNA